VTGGLREEGLGWKESTGGGRQRVGGWQGGGTPPTAVVVAGGPGLVQGGGVTIKEVKGAWGGCGFRVTCLAGLEGTPGGSPAGREGGRRRGSGGGKGAAGARRWGQRGHLSPSD
jgi:hypothetical protein